MSRDEQAGLAALLARKAQEDAIAVREFAGNSEIADGIIGFHAQQAVEKWLKAVMARREIQQARIHDIGASCNCFGRMAPHYRTTQIVLMS